MSVVRSQIYYINSANRVSGTSSNFNYQFAILPYNTSGVAANPTFSNVKGVSVGHFSEASSVVNDSTGATYGDLAWADFNNDGWTDIAIANDTWPNFLFFNKHDGTFEDVSFISGIAPINNFQ